MTIVNKGEKIKYGNNIIGHCEGHITQDTVINGQRVEASAAHPMIRVVSEGGQVSVQDPNKVTKL